MYEKAHHVCLSSSFMIMSLPSFWPLSLFFCNLARPSVFCTETDRRNRIHAPAVARQSPGIAETGEPEAGSVKLDDSKICLLAAVDTLKVRSRLVR